MKRRVFQFRCESCGLEEDIPAEEIENNRESKIEAAIKMGHEDLARRDWTYCMGCGGFTFRVWNPPAITFNGAGFTRTGR